MKYIKTFEINGEEYKVGDYVKKIKMANGEPSHTGKMIFKIDHIEKGRYKSLVNQRDFPESKYNQDGYFLYYVKDKEDYGWVASMQIRHLTDDEKIEMDADRYNL